MIGMVVMTILMSVCSVSCSSSDDDEKSAESASIVGTWYCPYVTYWCDTDVFEFKSDGTLLESLYNKSEVVLEEKGTYVYSNGKLTAKREVKREKLDNGQWSSWKKNPDTVVYDATIKDNKLILSNLENTLVLDRK